MANSLGVSQEDVNGLVAPIIGGALLQNMLFGMLLVVFCNFVRSPGWARASGSTRVVLIVVLLLTTASTALYARDIFFYTLTFTDDFNTLVLGPRSEPVEVLLIGVLAAVVQQTLALRASHLIGRRWLRWLYRIAIGCGSTVSLLCAVGYFDSWLAFLRGEPEMAFGVLDYYPLFEGWMLASAATDALISLSYILLIRSRIRDEHEVASSALRVMTRYVLQSASYTTALAVLAAVLNLASNQYDPAQFDLCFMSWLPCSVLYAFSLFTTLSIRDRVQDKLSHFPQPSRGADPEQGLGSFASHHTRSLRRDVSPHHRSALEGMITKPGQPAWEQRSTSFLGVRLALQPHEEPELVHDGRPSFKRAHSSAL